MVEIVAQNCRPIKFTFVRTTNFSGIDRMKGEKREQMSCLALQNRMHFLSFLRSNEMKLYVNSIRIR